MFSTILLWMLYDWVINQYSAAYFIIGDPQGAAGLRGFPGPVGIPGLAVSYLSPPNLCDKRSMSSSSYSILIHYDT